MCKGSGYDVSEEGTRNAKQIVLSAVDITDRTLWKNEQLHKPSGGIREGYGLEHLAIVPVLKQDEHPCELDNGAPC